MRRRKGRLSWGKGEEKEDEGMKRKTKGRKTVWRNEELEEGEKKE